MTIDVEKILIARTNATTILSKQIVQSLWSGYGEIVRYKLAGCATSSIIVKHIKLPKQSEHPRGWNTDLSHERKVKSYQVEQEWYQRFTPQANDNCRVPAILHAEKSNNEQLLIMEDLDASGFNIRVHHDKVTLIQAKSCLSWLAAFHGSFMNIEPKGLWEIGTYWHLDTRPDEWKQMENRNLKHAAAEIDDRLKKAQFQTLVHGDAKLANFCFNINNEVAGVDFQYVGKGCGMKDVAYLISSCFEENECEQYESELLKYYFDKLASAIDGSIDFQLLKKEWNELYPYAWADFYRFLDGWSPGHWKMHGYSKRVTAHVLKELNKL